MGRFSKRFFLFVVVVLIGIQFIEVDRTNPPVTAEIIVPQSLMKILETSCFDCHSNYTKWPWYSGIAPLSFLIAGHVNDGRKVLNFSDWEKYNPMQRIKLRAEIWEVVAEDEMPLKMYTYLHPKSILTPEQKKIVKKWSDSMLR